MFQKWQCGCNLFLSCSPTAECTRGCAQGKLATCIEEGGGQNILVVHWNLLQSQSFWTFKEHKNKFYGSNSASLCSLAGRYDNSIPTSFLATIDCLKIPAQDAFKSDDLSPPWLSECTLLCTYTAGPPYKVHIHYTPRVQQRLSHRPHWSPLPPLPHVTVSLPRNQRGGGNLACGWGGGKGSSISDDWRKSLAMSLICGPPDRAVLETI